MKLSSSDVFKRSILTIHNKDNLCLPRSLVAAHIYEIHGNIRSGFLHDRWNIVRRSNSTYQTEQANKVVKAANVTIPVEGYVDFVKLYLSKNTIHLLMWL